MLPNKNASPPCGNSFKLQTHNPKIQMNSMNRVANQPILFSFNLDGLLFLCSLQLNNAVSFFNASPIFPTAWFTFPGGALLHLKYYNFQTKFFIIVLDKLVDTHIVFQAKNPSLL